jgi:anti-sigma factor RsiW
MNQTMPRLSFEEVVLPHLDAAFNYARWLTNMSFWAVSDLSDAELDEFARALAR